MLFNTLHYFVFLIFLLPLYFSLGEKGQRRILFWFSLYFYSCLKLIFVPILFFSFFVTYLSTVKIHDSGKEITKRIWLWICLIVNLGILGFFKYTDFFRFSENDIRSLIGLPTLEIEPLGLILPLGISFYTFQAIAYTVDVYRGNLLPERKFGNFSLFLLFFPQLVAGPIMRANVLIPQFEGKKYFKVENVKKGLPIIFLGYFKKTIMADPISDIIAPIFQDPSRYDWITCLLGAVLFAMQIYGDFSGYSDIAIGTGRILGFDITKNFARPFFSPSTGQLWVRWHISLSTWLRDYVYISLGGSRVSYIRTFFNLFITMVIGGFWHGANWTFVAWGAINGVTVSIEKYFSDKGWSKIFEKVPLPFKIYYSFTIFSIGAIFFRSESIQKAFIQQMKILTFSGGEFFQDAISLSIWTPIILLLTYEGLQEAKLWEKIISNPIIKGLQPAFYIVLFVLCIMIYTVVSSPQFYYFQF
ncbi:MAG: MBOAT family protein [Leptospiraceae bacterium]|nr:MBOAT family protein [Leptospiraceae bacterium]